MMKKLKEIALFALIVIPWILNAQPCGSVNCNDTIFCIKDPEVKLKLCSPLGGQYSGTGVVNWGESFNPATANIGENELTYIYNEDTCHLIITVYDTLHTPANIIGPPVFCSGGTYHFSVDSVINAQSYIWKFMDTIVPTTIPELTLTLKPKISGNFFLTVRGNTSLLCGLGPESVPFPINITESPAPTIIDTFEVCKNESVPYTTTVKDYDTWNWSLSSFYGNIDGDFLSSTVIVNWNDSPTGVLKLTVSKSGCYGTKSLNITKTSSTAPWPVEIWRYGNNLLMCSFTGDSTTSYQWFANSVPISGATLPYYFVTDTATSGEIYVKACNSGTCCNRSKDFKFDKKKKSQFQSIATNFAVFPNPATDRLVIRKLLPEAQKYSYNMTDIYGKHLQAGYATVIDTEIDVSGLAAGVYFIRIDAGQEGTETHKIIVTH